MRLRRLDWRGIYVGNAGHSNQGGVEPAIRIMFGHSSVLAAIDTGQNLGSATNLTTVGG